MENPENVQTGLNIFIRFDFRRAENISSDLKWPMFKKGKGKASKDWDVPSLEKQLPLWIELMSIKLIENLEKKICWHLICIELFMLIFALKINKKKSWCGTARIISMDWLEKVSCLQGSSRMLSQLLSFTAHEHPHSCTSVFRFSSVQSTEHRNTEGL